MKRSTWVSVPNSPIWLTFWCSSTNFRAENLFVRKLEIEEIFTWWICLLLRKPCCNPCLLEWWHWPLLVLGIPLSQFLPIRWQLHPSLRDCSLCGLGGRLGQYSDWMWRGRTTKDFRRGSVQTVFVNTCMRGIVGMEAAKQVRRDWLGYLTFIQQITYFSSCESFSELCSSIL